eukprot:CAMPEP_0114987192 /NCGR_PEP_ID=MMETSP0216-20121206/8864_1 /TAXON_ID=223996 /ORGANISM="Protocruzia adherens, Strain Boccale" /LENGTH=396 /DNA_ID=CAMNT_0002349749 /DNA_START=134 /DNA_END=1321 /DNA_ORIENTATION=-
MDAYIKEQDKERIKALRSQIKPLEIIIEAETYINGKPTGDKWISNPLWKYTFKEMMLLAFDYEDLPLHVSICVNIRSYQRSPSDPPIASTTIDLFNENLTQRKRKHLFKLHPNTKADPSIPSVTPALVNGDDYRELYRRYHEYERYQNKANFETIRWLDKTTIPTLKNRLDELLDDIQSPFVEVDFLGFDGPVLFEEKRYTFQNATHLSRTSNSSSLNNHKQTGSMIKDINIVSDANVLFKTPDPIKDKFYTLHRTLDNIHAKDLRPTTEELTRINALIIQPDFFDMNEDEKYLLWTYRYSLIDRPTALSKFLHAVNWGRPEEEKEAIKLMRRWTPIDLSDAIHLLSSFFADNPIYQKKIQTQINSVRKYARSDDEQVGSILLQLVQALRYENFSD